MCSWRKVVDRTSLALVGLMMAGYCGCAAQQPHGLLLAPKEYAAFTPDPVSHGFHGTCWSDWSPTWTPCPEANCRREQVLTPSPSENRPGELPSNLPPAIEPLPPIDSPPASEPPNSEPPKIKPPATTVGSYPPSNRMPFALGIYPNPLTSSEGQHARRLQLAEHNVFMDKRHAIKLAPNECVVPVHAAFSHQFSPPDSPNDVDRDEPPPPPTSISLAAGQEVSSARTQEIRMIPVSLPRDASEVDSVQAEPAKREPAATIIFIDPEAN